MEVRAISKSLRISPRKMRLVADAVRALPIDEALRVLSVQQQKAAGPFTKTLNSAVANAVTNAKLERNNLVIATVMVNPGQVLKRFRPSTRGRIHPYKKRGSHLTIILKEKIVAAPVLAKALEAKKVELKVKDEKTASVKTTAVKEGGKK
jgi:large subunit ribosomal protein L22